MLEGIRILLVEDYVDHQRLYTTALQECGAIVTTAGSIQEAWGLFEMAAPHVLVSEISLVDGDGSGLIQAIRRLDAEHGGLVPAVALTSSVREKDRERALAAGFDEHCMKVDDIDVFVGVVARLAGRADDRLLRRPA